MSSVAEFSENPGEEDESQPWIAPVESTQGDDVWDRSWVAGANGYLNTLSSISVTNPHSSMLPSQEAGLVHDFTLN